MGKARRLESAIAAGVEGVARRVAGSESPAPRPALELVHAIVDDVEREVQPAGRGRRVFPFTHVRVALVAAAARDRAYLEAALDGPPSLTDRIAERLQVAGCAARQLVVSVTFVTRPKPDWSHPEFHVDYGKSTAAPIVTEPLRLDLAVVAGVAEAASYVFTTFPVAIGRGGEVRDGLQQLIRTNHVAFSDGDDVTSTVSRRHAHIEHDVSSDSLRVVDDGSAQGTTVIRQGRGHAVPRGTRGLRLKSGDEIVLGRVRLSVTIGAD